MGTNDAGVLYTFTLSINTCLLVLFRSMNTLLSFTPTTVYGRNHLFYGFSLNTITREPIGISVRAAAGTFMRKALVTLSSAMTLVISFLANAIAFVRST